MSFSVGILGASGYTGAESDSFSSQSSTTKNYGVKRR